MLWAIGGTYASKLIHDGASPVELTEARAWVSVIGLAVIVALRRRGRAPSAPIRSHAGLLIVFGLFMGVANLTYYLSIEHLPVAVAIVIQYSAPALVVAWKYGLEARMPPPKILVALALVIVGVVALSGVVRVLPSTASVDRLGLLFAVAAALSFAGYVLTGEKVSAIYPTEVAVFYSFVVSGAMWVVVQAFRGMPDTLLDRRFMLPALFLGVFTTILPFTLFMVGLRRISAAPAGIISTLEPVSAALLAYAFLGQRLSVEQIIGAVAVIAGIAVVQSIRSATVPPPD